MTFRHGARPSFLLVLATALPVFAEEWSPRRAADYLDARQKDWFAWKAATAPGGPCVSCHTGVTYLLARPVLRKALGESQPTSYEKGLTAGLRARAGNKDAREVFRGSTTEPKLSQAAAVEAIVAALALALEDAGKPQLSAEAKQAFARIWSMQIKEGNGKGGWPWFDLNLDPWEMPDSRFYGATLAALAVGNTPTAYRKRPDVAANIENLVAYFDREQATQPLHNRLMLLFASGKLKNALSSSARKAIVAEAWGKQQVDGGWTIEALGPWKEHPAAPPQAGTNSYATGLVAFVLADSGVPRSDPRLSRALAWLKTRQDREGGYWPAESMNKKFEPTSMMFQFMRDAATAFSVMALSGSD